MRQFLFIFLLFTLIFPLNADEDNKKIKIDFESETSCEVGIRDKDNSTATIIGLKKNVPEISEEAELFIRLKTFDNKRIIFGPYISTDIGMRFDHRNKDESTLFVEQAGALLNMGVMAGYKFGKKNLKDSYFRAIIPVSADFDLRFTDSTPQSIITDPTDPLTSADYLKGTYTGVRLGSQIGLILRLRFDDQYLRFKAENYTTLLGELYRKNYSDPQFKGFIMENRLYTELQFAPFNFIDNDIDVWLTAQNRFTIGYDSFDLDFDERAYFEVEWKGLSFLHLGWKPIVYNLEFSLPLDTKIPYNQYQSIGMEVWLKAGYKFFWAEISYEPTIFAIDKTKFNTDDLKTHVFGLSFTFEID